MSGTEEIAGDDAPEIVKVEDTTTGDVLPGDVPSDTPEIEEEIEQSPSGQKEVPPQEGIQDLKRRLEAEQQARLEAEQYARAAQMEAQRRQAEAQDSNYQMVLSAISTVEQNALALRSAYAEAMTSGDYDRAAQIQEAITVNTSNLSDLKRGRQAMEEAAKRQQAQQRVQEVEPPRDPIEDWATRVTPRSANWLRANKNALSNQAMMKRVMLAHALSQDEGLEPDSDAYFEFIERNVGLRKQQPPARTPDAEPDADSPLSAASAPAPRRSAPPPAAPVSRGTPRANAVRLTPAEREAARVSGISEEEYARNKERIRNGGRS